MILKDLKAEKLTFKKEAKKYLKKFLLLFFWIEIYQSLGAIMFFYVEECLAYGVNVKSPGIKNDLNTFCVEICNELRSINITLGKIRNTNFTVDNNNTLNHDFAITNAIQNATYLCKQQQCTDSIQDSSSSSSSCKITSEKFMKWSVFSYAVLYTIGYGDIVPKSKLGKILTMLYALCGIPITGASLVLGGRVIKNYIQLFVVFIEESVFKRKQVRYFQRKTIALLALLTLVVLLLYACVHYLLSRHVDDYDFFDWFYFSFITTSTIGFGDIVLDYTIVASLGPGLQFIVFVVMYVVYYIGMSAVSSIISIMTNFETERSCKKNKGDKGNEETVIENNHLK